MAMPPVDYENAMRRGRALLSHHSRRYAARNVTDYIKNELGGSDDDVQEVLNDLGLT